MKYESVLFGPPAWNAVAGYAVAILSALVAIGSLSLLEPDWQAPVFTFIVATYFAAWYGGARPGLLALTLSLVFFELAFVPMHGSSPLAPREIVRALTVALAGGYIIWTTGRLRGAFDSMRRGGDQLRGVIDAIPVMAWTCRADGSMEFLNRRWLEYSGFSIEEALKEPLRTIHADDVQHTVERWRHCLASGENFEDEMRLRRADGEYRWFLVRTVPVRNARGEILRWYGTSTDIEDRRRAEEQLRAVIETIPAITWTTQADGSNEFTNRSWYEYTGLSVDESKGDGWQRAVHPDDLENHARKWRAAALTGEPFENEARYRRAADGQYRWFLVRGVPLRDEQGRTLRWYGMLTDIEDRKRVETSTQQSRELLRQVLATLPVGVVVTDRSGNAVMSNAVAKRIWGDEIIVDGEQRRMRSRGFWHGSGEPVAPQDWASHRALTRGETSLNELIDIETFDGRRRTMQNSAAPLRDAQGAIVGAVVVNEDVTERVGAADALRDSAEHLQQLSRRLLLVQEEERRHLSRELHDEFGQVLGAIALHLQAAKSSAGETAQASLDECLRLLQRAGTEVRSLALDLRPAMLETAGLDATLRWLAGQHQQRTGTRTSIEGHLGEVNGDAATAFFRVAQEALTNAQRHAPGRSVSMDLGRRETALELVIRDEGDGFEPKATLEQASQRGHLGLLGMKERMEILGGRLEVDSAPGRGTTIRASLPLEEAVREPAAHAL